MSFATKNPTTEPTTPTPISSTPVTPQTARTNSGSQSGRKGKAWEESKSWRREPIQFGDLATVHPERAESSSAVEEGANTPEPVEAKAVVGTPTQLYVPKGGHSWAEDVEEEEKMEVAKEEVVKASAVLEGVYFWASGYNGEEEEEVANEEVMRESSDIVGVAAASNNDEEASQVDLTSTPSATSDPESFTTEAKVPDLIGDLNSSPSVISEGGMPTTPDFEQLPEVEVAIVAAIVPGIGEDIPKGHPEDEIAAGAEEDTVSKDPVPDVIVTGDPEDFASSKTPLQDNLPAEEEIVQPVFEQSEEATSSGGVDCAPSTPKQSAETPLDNEIEDIEVGIEHADEVEVVDSDKDKEILSTPKLEESTEIVVDDELPVVTTPIRPVVPAIPVISYAQIAAAASSSPTKATLPMSPQPKNDIGKAKPLPQTPVKRQTRRVQTSTPTPNVQAPSTTLELKIPVFPSSPTYDSEWEQLPAEANQHPSEWSTVTPKKPRKPLSPPGSRNSVSDNGDEGVVEDEAVLETPTKSKSKRRRPKSRAVKAAEKAAAAQALAGVRVVETPLAEIQTPTQVIEAAAVEETPLVETCTPTHVLETSAAVVEIPLVEAQTPTQAIQAVVVEETVVAEPEMETEIPEIQVTHSEASEVAVSHIEKLQEEDEVLSVDTWSSAQRFFFVILALWFGYSCIYYMPDFLQWMKYILASDVPEL
ncbi:hypothetical protein IFR05_013587 [Cadophora sp. M221]|nr:hypothetical protein IFR05_013587 [Cadophora sp. M221]